MARRTGGGEGEFEIGAGLQCTMGEKLMMILKDGKRGLWLLAVRHRKYDMIGAGLRFQVSGRNVDFLRWW